MNDAPTPFEAARVAVDDGAPVEAAAATVVAAMSRHERLWCLDGDAPTWAGLESLGEGGYHTAPFHAARVDRLGLRGISFSDGPRGVVIGNATCFPVPMARGATWDPALEERVGDAIGRELRASGATLFGGVCVNLLRHPGWGRAQETYGEDPCHVGELGAALTRGVQRHAMATVKHFAANSIENSRFRVDVEVDDVALHEVYLAQFRRIVDEGVACVMSAYNRLDGEYCGEHRRLLTEILRDEWGFEGFVISDWIFGLRDAARSLRAGLDIEMPFRMVRAEHLADAIERGDAAWEDVDRAVERIVATLLRFDGVLAAPSPAAEAIGAAEHVELAREVAARSVVLLRNEPVDGSPVLPIDGTAVTSVAVLGRLADRVNLGDGGSSDVYSLDNVTLLDGIRTALPGARVEHDAGDDPDRAAATASVAEVALVVVGYTSDDEGEYIGDAGIDLRHLFPDADDPDLVDAYRSTARVPTVVPDRVGGRGGLGFARGGDRTSLRLTAADEQLIAAVAAANPRTVVAIQSGSAVVVGPWLERVAAVVQAWYGGQQAGHGLADVLVGDVDAAGRLPFTIPADEADLPSFDPEADRAVYDRWHGWWRAERLGLRPSFPFGFGLSYTSFELTGFEVAVDGDVITAACRIANIGDRDGADVVQVYAELPDAAAPRRLVGFRRVEVPARRSVDAEIEVPVDRLATRDPRGHCWTGARGRHVLTASRFAGDPAGRRIELELVP